MGGRGASAHKGGGGGSALGGGLSNPQVVQNYLNRRQQKINQINAQQQQQQQQNQQQQQPQPNNQNVNSLIQQMQSALQGQNWQANYQNNQNTGNTFHAGEGSSANDYTADNNAALLKYQSADDAKSQRYIAKIGKQSTPAQDSEGYTYHQSAFQNMVIDQNLNAPVYATLNNADFQQYCKQTGMQPFYRGWSSSDSMSRFTDATNYHTGTGIYGEGIYCGDRSTAYSYANGNNVSKMALSPNARVVDLADVQNAIRNSSSGMQKALSHSGYTATSNYGSNNGEAQMALKMGYNVIRTSWSYVVLTRDAVIVNK